MKRSYSARQACFTNVRVKAYDRAMRFTTMFLMLAATSVTADTEIHRCLLDDGSFAFQETPCPEPAAKTDDDTDTAKGPVGGVTPAVVDDVFDFVNPFDEPENAPTPLELSPPEPASKVRSECEQTTRDAIDAIDLEMRETNYSKEQGQEYLAELLELTRQLRACKQL